MTKEELVPLIIRRIESERENLIKVFHRQSSIQTKFFCLDHLLPEEIAQEIYESFPKERNQWREMNSFREKKLTSKNLERFPAILKEITFAIQDKRVVKLVEEITAIREQIPDPSLYAGGLSLMQEGDFLNPHIDNSHDQERRYYRTLNLLYYVSPGWEMAFGGNLELWDEQVMEKVTIVGHFNRLVVMATNRKSWHSVSKVKANRNRCCVSNYYFSPRPPEENVGEYFHITAFNGRPEEPLRRMYCKMDNQLRSSIRKMVKFGLGKKDQFVQHGKNENN